MYTKAGHQVKAAHIVPQVPRSLQYLNQGFDLAGQLCFARTTRPRLNTIH